MKGGIYSDQRCIVCGAKMRDTGRDVSCSVHPQVKATRFRVKFGTLDGLITDSTDFVKQFFGGCIEGSRH